MIEKIDIALGNQLKELYGFDNKTLIEFYKAFKKVDIEKKERFLLELDKKIKGRNKILNDFLIKTKLMNNKIKEFIENKKVNINL